MATAVEQLRRERINLETLGSRRVRKIAVAMRVRAIKALKSGKDPRAGISSQLPVLQDAVLASMILSHLRGQLRSRTAILEKGPRKFAMDPLSEALRFVKERANLSGDDIERLKSLYGDHASKVASGFGELVDKKLAEATEEIIGKNLHIRDGVKVLQERLDASGLTSGDLPKYSLERMIRDQVNLAYMAGRLSVNESEEVRDLIWGYEYTTVGDDRVREEHMMLEGVRLPKDDPFWEKNMPPNGYNCRCSVIEIFNDEDTTPVPPPEPELVIDEDTGESFTITPGADTGFEFNPLTLFKDLKYPELPHIVTAPQGLIPQTPITMLAPMVGLSPEIDRLRDILRAKRDKAGKKSVAGQEYQARIDQINEILKELKKKKISEAEAIRRVKLIVGPDAGGIAPPPPVSPPPVAPPSTDEAWRSNMLLLAWIFADIAEKLLNRPFSIGEAKEMFKTRFTFPIAQSIKSLDEYRIEVEDHIKREIHLGKLIPTAATGWDLKRNDLTGLLSIVKNEGLRIGVEFDDIKAREFFNRHWSFPILKGIYSNEKEWVREVQRQLRWEIDRGTLMVEGLKGLPIFVPDPTKDQRPLVSPSGLINPNMPLKERVKLKSDVPHPAKEYLTSPEVANAHAEVNRKVKNSYDDYLSARAELADFQFSQRIRSSAQEAEYDKKVRELKKKEKEALARNQEAADERRKLREKTRNAFFKRISPPEGARVEFPELKIHDPAGRLQTDEMQLAVDQLGEILAGGERIRGLRCTLTPGIDGLRAGYSTYPAPDPMSRQVGTLNIGKDGLKPELYTERHEQQFGRQDPTGRVMFHELGHVIESHVEGAQEAACEFLRYRSKGHPTKPMNVAIPEMSDTQEANKDEFDRFWDEPDTMGRARAWYCGKFYNWGPGSGVDTEIISMGLEAMWLDPEKFFRKDPEYANFILGILDGSLRKKKFDPSTASPIGEMRKAAQSKKVDPNKLSKAS